MNDIGPTTTESTTSPESLAGRWFTFTMIGVVVYVSAIIVLMHSMN